jgi:hypothetical protein
MFQLFKSGLRDPRWARKGRGGFHRLLNVDPDEEGIAGVGGILVVWHSGVRPKWVYVGRSNDLAAAILELSDDGNVNQYEAHGGLFVSWALIRPAHQDGVVRYLTATLDPLVENPYAPGDDVEPISVLSPGAKVDAA